VRSRRWFLAAIFLASVVVLANVPVAQATTGITRVKLDNSGGSEFKISPDGKVVALTQTRGNEENVLVVAPTDGSKPSLKLTTTPDRERGVRLFEFTPNSQRLVYTADLTDSASFLPDLFTVPISGGVPLALNTSLLEGEGIRRFALSPDGQRVVYSAQLQGKQGVKLLYSVPITGGVAVQLSQPITSTDKVEIFEISPDSKTVLFLTNGGSGFDELFSVPITGGTPVKLNGTPSPNPEAPIIRYNVSSDSQYVVYRIDRGSAIGDDLFSVPIAGGTPVKLNGTLTSEGQVKGWEITPDGSKVIYIANQDTFNRVELYQVPIAGGTPVKLSGPIEAGGRVRSWEIAPDGLSVVYVGSQESPNRFELYQVPVAGGTVVRLSSSTGPGVVVNRFAIAPDGSRAVYLSASTDTGGEQLYSVPLGGGTVTQLTRPRVNLGAFHTFTNFTITADSTYVVYEVENAFMNTMNADLFRTTIDKEQEVNISKLPSGSEVGDVQISPDGSFLTYSVASSGGRPLYWALVANATPVLVDSSLSGSTGSQITPKLNRVVYQVLDTSDITALRQGLFATLEVQLKQLFIPLASR
jgi:Tol biopolymer transport system component